MKEQVLTTIENSRNYSMAVAAAMPQDLYHTRPTNNSWTFGDLVNHIGYGIRWWESNFIRKVETPWDPPALPNNKDEVMLYLEASYEILKQTAGSITLSMEELQGFHATIDHITHHRGQAVLYLRYNDIAAPEYIY